MSLTNKKTVCVLFGGRSSEHEVSLSSAKGVLDNIDRTKYDVIPVKITKDGRWLLVDSAHDGEEGKRAVTVDVGRHGLLISDGDHFEFAKLDAVLPILHGAFGEDGTIQGLFAIAGIPCVGCGCEASAVGMDKAATKAILNQAGIPQAKAVVLSKSELIPGTYENNLEKELGYPMFVKPARAGSSIGISKVKTRDDLASALDLAAHHDTKILVEEAIVGREIEVAVLEEGGKLTVSVPAEIDPGCEFYDYDAKYISDVSSFYIPARISDAETKAVRALAGRIFELLGCNGLSRVDFFVCDDSRIIFNEINTLPGFTPISMYPKLMQNEGMSYTELIDRLICSAIL